MVCGSTRVRGHSATLGPGVILGHHVRVGEDVSMSHSVVLDGVAVGGGLEIRECLVHASGIANLAWGAIVPAEALGSLLGSAVARQSPRISFLERLLALLLLLLLPVLSLLPGARGTAPLAQAFRSRFRGGLGAVILGRRALVGRSTEATGLDKELENEPFGAIAVGDTWGASSADEHVLADIYWCTHRTWPYRLGMVQAYLRALATGRPA